MIDLNKDEDLTFSINTLKTLFIKDNKTSAYLAYEKLESFQRSAEMSTIDYLNAFQRLYFKDYISKAADLMFPNISSSMITVTLQVTFTLKSVKQ